MAPIRTALIGLSSSAITAWASQAHLPYLLSEHGKSRFKITALLNSSVDAAKAAIAHYNLGSDVKAYGSPEDLAADKDIDFVACATRVDVHYDTIKPSVAAGKAVFVEWPLAENVKRASELADLAKQTNATTIVGIQARVSPVVTKVKEVLESGAIGKVVSSNLQLTSPYVERTRVSAGLAYFLDKKVGGNPVTIGLAHTLDFIHYVLGEYEDFNAHTQIQHPNKVVYDKDSGEERQVTSDVPDLVSLHGTLKPSSFVMKGASLTATYQVAPPWPGTLPLTWTVTGEKGELRITASKTAFLNVAGSGILIEQLDFASNEVKSIDWEFDAHIAELPERARIISKLYNLFAEGKLQKAGAADFAAAVVRHKEIDSILWT
ncbi:hypothetical protein B0A48_10115 [Cryoendolithus antarcticus]|uniref:Uncharacterized protein n=1 Tax=Cryoendolithus antarcticus TaxID=1507870 RepID=A0A1V8SWN8_9PEZI|nr:hypothetical protein B0A48_10115 [Cryoendolithus antarcticus]